MEGQSPGHPGEENPPPGSVATPPRGETCAFCGRLGEAASEREGGLGRLLGPFGLSGGALLWVHRPCAVWSPRVTEDDGGLVEESVLREVRRGKQMKCSFCGRPGATMGCRLPQKQCEKIYHYPCAMSAGCEKGNDWMITCPRHAGRRERQPPRPAQDLPGAFLVRNERETRQKVDAERKTAAWKRRRIAEEAEDDEGYFQAKERRRFQRDVGLLQPMKLGNPAQGAATAGGAAAAGKEPGAEGVGWDSVAGLQSHVAALKEMVMLPLQYPEVVQALGITPPRGVLLHGEPGTGKTLVVRALAAACARGAHPVSFFSRKGADCLGKYHGEAERTLRLLFEDAVRQQPSIVFFDEIDGLVPARGHREGTQDQVHASVVTTLLALMDGVEDRGLVVVLGATNRPESVDPALRRPGRFDRELHFPLPTPTQRAEILALHTRHWTPRPSAQVVEAVAAATSGFAGADLRSLCSEAVLAALQRQQPRALARYARAARRRGGGGGGEGCAGGLDGAAGTPPPIDPADGASVPPPGGEADGAAGAQDGTVADEDGSGCEPQPRGAGVGGVADGRPDGGAEAAAEDGGAGQPGVGPVPRGAVSPDGPRRDPLGDLAVSAADWRTAIQSMPPPCSRRSAASSAMDGASAARPLPHHLVPLLGPHLVAAVAELRSLRSAGAVLPAAAGEALDAVLARPPPPPDRGGAPEGWDAALEDVLCRVGAFAGEVGDGASAGGGTDGTELGKGGLSLADVLRLDGCEEGAPPPRAGDLEEHVQGARRRCSILLAGDGDQGQGAVAAAVLQLMEGSPVFSLGLPSLLVDGDGDASKGASRVLREALLRAPASSVPTVLVLPRIDAWAGEEGVAGASPASSPGGPEQVPCPRKAPAPRPLGPPRDLADELPPCPRETSCEAYPGPPSMANAGVPYDSVLPRPTGSRRPPRLRGWRSRRPWPRGLHLVRLSSSRQDLPYEVVELFSPYYPDEGAAASPVPPDGRAGSPLPSEPGRGLGGFMAAEMHRPQVDTLRRVVDRAVGSAVALATAEELAEREAIVDRHRRATAAGSARNTMSGPPHGGHAGCADGASGGAEEGTPGADGMRGAPAGDPAEEEARREMSKELGKVGDILLQDCRYTLLMKSLNRMHPRPSGGPVAGDWADGARGNPLHVIAAHASRAPSPAALLARLQREVSAVIKHERRHRQRAKLMQIGRGIGGGMEYSPVEAAGSAVLDVVASICFRISRRFETDAAQAKRSAAPTAAMEAPQADRGSGGVVHIARAAGGSSGSPGRGGRRSGAPTPRGARPSAAAVPTLEDRLLACRGDLQRAAAEELLRLLPEGAPLEQVELGRAAVLGALREAFRLVGDGPAAGGEALGAGDLGGPAHVAEGWGDGMALVTTIRAVALEAMMATQERVPPNRETLP